MTAPAAGAGTGGPVRAVPTPLELLERLKAADPSFAAQAEAKGRFQVLPPRKAMADLLRATPGAEDELIRDRFLCRGGAVMLAAHTGKGKSSLVRQIAVCFAAGLPIFGLAPVRPLRQLIIQAENDEGDEAAFRDGVARCPYVSPDPAAAEAGPPEPLDPITFAQATAQVIIARCVDKAGVGFLETLGALLAADGPFDLVWVDPLLAFLGGDINDQKSVSAFLRTGLQPLMLKHSIGLGLVHHTPKPIRQQQSNRGAPVVDIGAYLGAGSAELANWPRAVLALESTNHRGVFRFRAPKRGGRLGWRDTAGQPTDSRYLAHATDGSIYWREPDPEELAAALDDTSTPGKRGTTKASVQDVVDILLDRGGEVQFSELRDLIMGKTGCSRSYACSLMAQAKAETLLRVRGSQPAIYRVTDKAKRSNFNPVTGGK